MPDFSACGQCCKHRSTDRHARRCLRRSCPHCRRCPLGARRRRPGLPSFPDEICTARLSAISRSRVSAATRCPWTSIVQFHRPRSCPALSKFVFDVDAIATTHCPAKRLENGPAISAATMLLSLSVPSAKGMNRFVRNSCTGTTTPELGLVLQQRDLAPSAPHRQPARVWCGVAHRPRRPSNTAFRRRSSRARPPARLAIPAPPPDTTTVSPRRLPGQTHARR